jgi:hypothetical protein
MLAATLELQHHGGGDQVQHQDDQQHPVQPPMAKDVAGLPEK